MFEAIKKCDKCELCKHQAPLLDTAQRCQVFWVGLSAKKSISTDERPLSPMTKSGSILLRVEETLSNVVTYRTNIVKCVPLDDNMKLRYPNKREIDMCMPHIDAEIQELSPQIVFLLGRKVTEAVSRFYSIDCKMWDNFDYQYVKYNNIYFVPIHHPAYIQVYKRKQAQEYVLGIRSIIEQLL